jgi:hypothetical protein
MGETVAAATAVAPHVERQRRRRATSTGRYTV